MRFLAGLDFTLNNGLPEEKLTALRRCIEKIHINKPAKKATLAIRLVPVGGLNTVQERSISI
jgi:hypothetical protein